MSVEQSNVLSMLELSVKGQRETSSALTMMFETIREMAATTQEAKAQAQAAVSEVREIAEEVRNSVWLFPAESNSLHDFVRDRSIDLAKMNQASEAKFTEVVGKIRRRIWSDLKKRYGVAKYIYIPHKYYTDAMNFVEEFSLVG